MIVTLNRRTLLDALEVAKKWVAPTKGTPPICLAALLRTDGDGVEVWRTDLDRQAVIAIDAAISRHGEAAVSAHALYRIAKTSRATSLELKLEPLLESEPGKAQLLTVRAGAATYSLIAFSRETEFPHADVLGVPNLVRNLPAASLRWLIGATVYAAGKLNESPTDCVELHCNVGELRAVATDGRRAAISDLVQVDTAHVDGPVYLPADSAARLLANKAECMVSAALGDDKRLHLTLGRQTNLSCRTVDRTYPDIEAAVQRNARGEEVVAQREQLLAALDRATAVLAGAAVHLTAGDDQLTLAGEHLGCRVVERLPARAAGAERSVAVNPSYAIDALTALTSSEVSLRIAPEALTVRPVLQDEMTQRQLAVIMAVRTPEEERNEPTDEEPAAGEQPAAVETGSARLGVTAQAIANELAKHPGDAVEFVTVTIPGEGSATIHRKDAKKSAKPKSAVKGKRAQAAQGGKPMRPVDLPDEDDGEGRAALIANGQCPDCGGTLPKGWLTCGKCT